MPANAVERFQERFAQWLGVRWAWAFWKGRVAMYAILRALGVGPGDEVLLPGYTCVMDVNPVKYLGATPVYADIDPVTYNALPEEVERLITPRTKVLVAQHTYGYPCPMDALTDIARRHDLPLVEDCCLAFGSTYRDRLCGTFGRAAYFSFQWNKPFTTGLGGLATTDDADLAARIRALCEDQLRRPSAGAAWLLAAQRCAYRAVVFPRTTAAITSVFRFLTRKGLVIGSSSTAEFTPTLPENFFTGFSPGQARAGLRQLRRLEANIRHRRAMARLYREALADAGWNLPEPPAGIDPVLVRFPVRVADKERAVQEAPAAGVEIGTWFESPLHPAETPLELYDYTPGLCPAAERACREVVNLPTHPRAGEKTALRTVEFLRRIGPPDDA